MSFRNLSHFGVYRIIQNKNILSVSKKISFDQGSKNDFRNRKNLLSQDESKALWSKININTTLQIIHQTKSWLIILFNLLFL